MSSNKAQDFENSGLANFSVEEIGEEHLSKAPSTPVKSDIASRSEAEKIQLIQQHFQSIMEVLGLDLNDDSLKGTPYRVAKMYVEEIFSGLNPENKPKISLFDNKYQYNEMLIEKNIQVHSHCEHHLLPIEGRAHVAYISNGKVIGLSKINRIVEHFAKRPQVQERLTKQIADALREALNTEDVAVLVDANHLCVRARGIQDVGSSTITAEYSGRFKEKETRNEFLTYVQMKQDMA